MWLFTAYGMYSAVAHREAKDTIIVRARSLADIDALRSRHSVLAKRKVKLNLSADYPWRMNVKRNQWGMVCMDEAMAIDYDNFKNAVTRHTSARRHNTYIEVWRALQVIEDEPGSGVPRAKPTPKRTVVSRSRAAAYYDNWGRMPVDMDEHRDLRLESFDHDGPFDARPGGWLRRP